MILIRLNVRGLPALHKMRLPLAMTVISAPTTFAMPLGSVQIRPRHARSVRYATAGRASAKPNAQKIRIAMTMTFARVIFAMCPPEYVHIL